jgi:hypothetical protein
MAGSFALRGAVALSLAGTVALVAPGVASARPAPVAPRIVRPHVTAFYLCSAQLAGTVKTSATVAGRTPSTVSGAGAKVSMTGFESTFSIPGSVFDKAYQSGVRSFSGKMTKFDVTATDAKTSIVNVAKTPFTFGPIKLLPRNNPSVTVHVPTKPATIGPWIARSAGTMTFKTGTTVVTLFSPQLGAITAVCSPHPAVVLSTTKVS